MRNWMMVSSPVRDLLELAVAREPSASSATAPTAIARRRRRDTVDTFSGRVADFKGRKLREGNASKVPLPHLLQDQLERLDRRGPFRGATRVRRSPVVQVEDGSGL